MGKFLVTVSSKGGVGKSTLAYQVISACLYNKYDKKHKLLEIDDNNKTDALISSIVDPTSLNVKDGISKSLEELFNIFDDENIIIDAGGGNDTNEVIDALSTMGLDENIVYFIPILKNKNGIKNLIDTYERIRKNSNSKIVVVLNQTKTTDKNLIKREFSYFFGNKELNIKGCFEQMFKDDNLLISNLVDTNVYDISEDYNLTSYEIAKDDINIPEFLKKEREKGFENFKKALAFVNVYKECKKNNEESFENFYNEIKEVI
jgi:hypothetical protein